MGDGKLIKLTIEAYEDAKFGKKVQGTSKFTTLINPEKISLSHKVEFDSIQGENSTATPQKFKRVVPPELDLSLLFDATGVIPGSKQVKDERQRLNSNVSDTYFSVTTQLKELENLVIRYQEKFHKPAHLWVVWGDLDFRGVLQDYSVEYKLFNPNGSPIRAVAKLKLKDAKDEEYRAAKEDKKSPDLTHIRQVVEGDTLPHLCDTIYGSSKYYLEVAKMNGITNFRKLQPGQRLNFPPIEKLTT